MPELSKGKAKSEDHEQVFSGLGYFIYEFACLETMLRLSIIAAIEGDEDATMFLINRMDSKILLTKLRGILKQRHRLTENAKLLISECGEASDFRNTLLHQAPVLYDGHPVLFMAPFGSNIQRGQSSTPLTPLPQNNSTLLLSFAVMHVQTYVALTLR